MRITKETIRRAMRTFLQAFIAYIIGAVPLLDLESGKEALKASLIGIVVSALAAGIAAAMNLEPKETGSEGGSKLFYYNQNDYGNVNYSKPNGEYKTIAMSGCGVVSSCIVFNTLAGKELYSVADMAKYSINHGARDNYGTNIKTLLKALCKDNKNFSFDETYKESELVAHLKNGGMAICNQGNEYNIFSSDGHYVVAYRMDGDNIEIVDPQMYSGKYFNYDRPKRIVKRTTNGCVVSTKELEKAVKYRVGKVSYSHPYFLITYKKPQPTAPKIKNGRYVLTNARGIYHGAGAKTGRKKVKMLTANARLHTTSTKNNAEAYLKAGTAVDILETKLISSGNIWARIPSGWICVWEKKNIKKFVK